MARIIAVLSLMATLATTGAAQSAPQFTTKAACEAAMRAGAAAYVPSILTKARALLPGEVEAALPYRQCGQMKTVASPRAWVIQDAGTKFYFRNGMVTVAKVCGNDSWGFTLASPASTSMLANRVGVVRTDTVFLRGERGFPGQDAKPATDGTDGATGETGKDGSWVKPALIATGVAIAAALLFAKKGDKGDKGDAGKNAAAAGKAPTVSLDSIKVCTNVSYPAVPVCTMTPKPPTVGNLVMPFGTPTAIKAAMGAFTVNPINRSVSLGWSLRLP